MGKVLLFSSGVIERMINPKQRYDRDLSRNNFESDARQAVAVQKLDTLYSHLIDDCKRASHCRIKSIFSLFTQRRNGSHEASISGEGWAVVKLILWIVSSIVFHSKKRGDFILIDL